eukprot:Gregarina_sp_Pseudo_9__4318@NODE_447_length_2814_cov_17_010811_g423_i0_p1_GENE_NODE_447_length_2814_cov_17_010811_g423_i0NODE_447_length_2814_cov_17_010811_g423_i0_p1_ORF_typecomplete_len572_score156_71RRM_1/PF00076_22/5_1e16RRM_5/PF13893_6/0_0011RNA_bind/PF08675_11/0_022RRM_7/PF16367_5/0_045Limkainb1/PF11608_8/0_22_NODE_447_length_2814_cov_17_010811_g423_i05742289
MGPISSPLPWHNLFMDCSLAALQGAVCNETASPSPSAGAAEAAAFLMQSSGFPGLSSLPVAAAASYQTNNNTAARFANMFDSLPSNLSSADRSVSSSAASRVPRNAVTAADINKLHQAAKLFRLLPAKTQMILKQVHPEGPLNSDIFAAIMAATECVSPNAPAAVSVSQAQTKLAAAVAAGGGPQTKLTANKHRPPAKTGAIPPPTAGPTASSATLSVDSSSAGGNGLSKKAAMLGGSPSMTAAQLRVAEGNIPAGGLGAQTHGPPGANVFVFHIPNEWVERDLALHFAQFGPILSARIAADKNSGRRLGFGFVSFTAITSARAAVDALNGFSVAGKRLKVTIKRGEQQFAYKADNTHATNTHTNAHTNTHTNAHNNNNNDDSTTTQGSDTHKHSRYSSSTDHGVSSTAATHHESSSNHASNSDWMTHFPPSPSADLSSSAYRLRAGMCEHCRKNACGTNESAARRSSRCAGVEALARLKTIGDILTRLYERVTTTHSPLPDEAWLDILTNLLRTEPGRYFVFTLLMAAGLSLESSGGAGGGGGGNSDRSPQPEDQSSSCTDVSNECGSPG